MHRFRWVYCLATFAASASAQRSDIVAYIAARAENQRSFETLWNKSPDQARKADANVVVQLGPTLAGIVGTLQFTPPADSMTIQIGSMQAVLEGRPVADGVIFRLGDRAQVFVTDTSIFHAWTMQTLNTADPDELLKQATVLSSAFNTGAPATRCGYVPVNPRGRNVVTALMVQYSQEKTAQCSMDAVVVAVEIDHRLVVAQRMLPKGTKPNTSLASSLAQALLDRIPDR